MVVGKDDLPSGSASSVPGRAYARLRMMITTSEKATQKSITEALIHRSAWNRNSANFALTEFWEVRSSAHQTTVTTWYVSRSNPTWEAAKGPRVMGATQGMDPPPVPAHTSAPRSPSELHSSTDFGIVP